MHLERKHWLMIAGGVVLLALIFLILHALGVFGGKSRGIKFAGLQIGQSELTIYATDDFTDWCLADSILPAFKKANQCEVKVETFPGGNAILDRLLSEKRNPQADVVFGLDPTYLSDYLKNNLLANYTPSAIGYVDDRYEFDKSYHMVPVAYSYLAFVYDTKKVTDPPAYLGELQSEAWRDKIIMPDPRQTGVGRCMLLWTQAAYGGDGFGMYWRVTNGSVHSWSPSADQAYGRFINSAAPMVLNFATRIFAPQAAEHLQGAQKNAPLDPQQALQSSIDTSSTRYKYFIPQEGGYKYIEAVGIVQGTYDLSLAKKFVDYCLTDEVQTKIPETLWMSPVRKGIAVPPGFDTISLPARDFSSNADARNLGNTANSLVRQWKGMQ